jgi:hypothetical protein
VNERQLLENFLKGYGNRDINLASRTAANLMFVNIELLILAVGNICRKDA